MVHLQEKKKEETFNTLMKYFQPTSRQHIKASTAGILEKHTYKSFTWMDWDSTFFCTRVVRCVLFTVVGKK